MDGMRCDVDGNLYITRHGKGSVVIVSPAGKVLREIDVLGRNPTNLCFGGPDGRTCYVTEAERGRIVQFRTERPGLRVAALAKDPLGSISRQHFLIQLDTESRAFGDLDRAVLEINRFRQQVMLITERP